MSKPVNQQPGVSALVRAGAAVAAALAAVCITAGPGSAATEHSVATADDCTVSDPIDGWTTTRCEGSDEETVSKTWALSAAESVNSITADCGTADGYRLINEDFSPGRIVPHGVAILEPGGIGASSLVHRDQTNYAVGVQGLAMTNWSITDRSVTVVLHCTTDSTKWYL